MTKSIEQEIESVFKDEDLWKGRNVKEMFNIKLQKAKEELKKTINNAGNLPMLEKVIRLSDIEKVLGK